MISSRSIWLLVKNPSFQVVLAQRNYVPWQLETCCHSRMEFWPMNEGLLIIFQIQINSYIIRHYSTEINFRNLNNIRNKRTTCSKTKCSLANKYWNFPIGKFKKDILTFYFPFVLWNWLYITGFDFNLWTWRKQSLNLLKN